MGNISMIGLYRKEGGGGEIECLRELFIILKTEFIVFILTFFLCLDKMIMQMMDMVLLK